MHVVTDEPPRPSSSGQYFAHVTRAAWPRVGAAVVVERTSLPSTFSVRVSTRQNCLVGDPAASSGLAELAFAPWYESSRQDDGFARASDCDSGRPMILTVAIFDVADDAHVDLERHLAAALARD
jgi:hypothetical protein